MDILAICAVAVVSAVIALLLRRQSPQSAMMISVGAGVVIVLSIIKNMVLTADEISAILSAGGISSDYILILLKVLGICFVTEFTCDTVTEAGMLSLSTNISFAGKIMVLLTAMPLFRSVIGLVTDLAGAA